MKKTCEWTLQETIKFDVFGNESFADYFNTYIQAIPQSEKDAFDELMSKYVYPRFYKWYCIKEDIPLFFDVENPSEDSIKTLLIRIVSIFTNTFERYSTLKQVYSDNLAQLMKSVSSLSKTRFNDTPQNSGEFDTDSHSTNITTNLTETEMNSPINRIDEIQIKLRNIMLDWSNEFMGIFWR